jgi:hypothetical protein
VFFQAVTKAQDGGFVRQGLRDRDSVIGFAVQACGGELQQMLISGFATEPMTSESSMSYLRSLASKELAMIPGISNSEVEQSTNEDKTSNVDEGTRNAADMKSRSWHR